MVRSEYIPVFEESENTILDRMLGNEALAPWRKEPGDFVYDTVAVNPVEIKQLQVNQDSILKQAFPQYAEGEYLKLHLEAKGMRLIEATPNRRNISVNADAGVSLEAGHILSVVVTDPNGNPYEFAVDSAVTWAEPGTKIVPITCQSTGAATNVPDGSQFILKPLVPGIRSITDVETTIPGADQESDADAWARYYFTVTHPDTGGNKNDYVRWAQEVTGVGKAKCIPLWQGGGTVKVVIVDTEHKPASAALVINVQQYLDPGITGMGEGKAPCGAKVTAIAAQGVNIDIAAAITWQSGVDQVKAKNAFDQAITNYFKGVIFSSSPNVIFNKIAAILSFTEGISNFSNLKINAGTIDIVIGTDEVPVLGAVTFT